ncbi:acetylornithine deacetylase/succinyl-diaminopimelate desuccinylase-like protein [Motilibacter peucedani]|uniref:Acetylornithine deacetylase/succinyl-diaminopimelate desuccinylase-like protein n=1 Tax=Motilibacter peucedani TaxID=598650 RepID=A0A420XML3_9ACTN|nr:M20/M25/M40 family metallo-hydrolase [Motilibacter peucedani]RKS72514.1 acetylornithine deacetylase/succinyl-diaminopimelate desuccinylase-like protein [Motilibacter peucedani]
MTTVADVVAAQADQWLDQLVEWLRIPSQSGDPALAGEVRRSAEWLAAALRSAGFPTVELWETPGLPSVYAEWPADDPDAPVALVYAHHDVQPVEPLEQWVRPPYEPRVEGDRLYARGVADDKGHVAMHLLGLRAHLEAGGRSAPAVTLKLLVEGEEESGSPHFPALLAAQRERLACDVVVVSDTGMWAEDVPSTVIGLRGMLYLHLDLVARDVDLHSGSFGGAVLNPATAVARILGRLHDDDGRVAVPGFYDGVVDPSDEERALIASLPFDEQEWLANAHSRVASGEAGWTTLERVWCRPTAEVNGFWGGHVGAGSKTIVPREAHAHVSFRIVAGQEPAKVREAVEAWLADCAPSGAQLSLEWEGDGVRACSTSLDAPALQALHRAMETAFGVPVRVTREGGSGPEADIQEALGVPLVYLGATLPDAGCHAPNENAHIPTLLKGAQSAAHLWDELAALGAETVRREHA